MAASDWISPAGLRAIESDALTTLIPSSAMNDARLSLTARGLYTLLLSYQGAPVDPYEDAVENEQDIRKAIDELIASGYAVRVKRSEE